MVGGDDGQSCQSAHAPVGEGSKAAYASATIQGETIEAGITHQFS